MDFAHKFLELLRSVECHRHPQQPAIETENECSVSPTQPDRAFGDGFKHRLKIERRAADDLEYLRRGGLLLQYSVRSVVRWRNSLSSRVFSMAMTAWAAKFVHQRDLLVGERTHLAGDTTVNAPISSFSSQHRHCQSRSARPLARRLKRHRDRCGQCSLAVRAHRRCEPPLGRALPCD